MKRIVICYDGTWNAVSDPAAVTNVVRLGQAVKKTAEDDVQQVVYYNAGVGSGGPLDRFLGGVFGVGLRNNVKRGARLSDPQLGPAGQRRDLHLRLLARRLQCAGASRRHRRDRGNSQTREIP